MIWQLISCVISLGIYLFARKYVCKYIIFSDQEVSPPYSRLYFQYFTFFSLHLLIIFLLVSYTNYPSREIFIISTILLNLIFLDFEYQILPDVFTISLMWLGLLNQSLFTNNPNLLASMIVNITCIYLILRFFNYLYLIFKKKEGMGLGDVKLIAAFAAWFSMTEVINSVLLAIISAIFFQACIQLLYKKAKLNKIVYFPFGPWLSLSVFINMIVK